ncbi:VanZ family protein [Tautonia sociabilis]|uniref:VanZ family protein n=1 Tax=Tautonia sociabilis TaxID=2080755 RepID=A0A432MLV4_9BACT|nr:VanZ family protein [Tautonia sociabilis]RUL88260.1 VanZ family protein [Tautonia sociabilis]
MMTLRSVPAILWTVLIVLICVIPASWFLSGGEGDGPSLLDRLLLGLPPDKVIHFVLFAGFGVLWRLAGAPGLATLLGGVALAVLTELIQTIPALDRSADLPDLLTDLAALAVSLVLFPRGLAPVPRSAEAAGGLASRDE